MDSWFWRWLANRVRCNALRGRFHPVVSAWGNAGVWCHETSGMEFQADTWGDVLWKVGSTTVFRGDGDGRG